MSVASVTAAGRRAAERLMTSRATIRRRAQGYTQTPDAQVPNWATPLTDVPVRIGSQERSTTVGQDGAKLERGTRKASLPIGTNLRDGDFLQLTAGENVGDVWRVVDVSRGDHQTALRVTVVADKVQGGWP